MRNYLDFLISLWKKLLGGAVVVLFPLFFISCSEGSTIELTSVLIGSFAIFAIVGSLLKWFISDYLSFKSNSVRESERRDSFNKLLCNLGSDDPALLLSNAVLLRRFIVINETWRKEVVLAISSLLRLWPSGIEQKTLGDTLSYSENLSGSDFQKTNMQDLSLTRKDGKPILLNQADLYLANLSFSLIDNVRGEGTVFYHAKLSNCSIKNSQFTNSNFCNAELNKSVIKNSRFFKSDFNNADLTDVRLSNVILSGCSFINAVNIPREIEEIIKDKGYVVPLDYNEPFTTAPKSSSKRIFLSKPGCANKQDEAIVNAYISLLESYGYYPVYLKKENYSEFGQMSNVSNMIKECCGMIAFGFHQINVESGQFRPNTCESSSIDGTWLSTPWTELEVGMAMMEKIPILLVKERDLKHGVFDPKLSEANVFSIDSQTNLSDLPDENAIRNWVARLPKD